jgi:hypothetical protein
MTGVSDVIYGRHVTLPPVPMPGAGVCFGDRRIP